MLRARVVGIEGEPLRVVEKTMRRRRKIRRMKHKMRHTVLRVCEFRVLTEGEVVSEGSESFEGDGDSGT